MKKPLLNEDQRRAIKLNTLEGTILKFSLELSRLKRDSYREKGYFYMRKTMRGAIKLINYKLFNTYYKN